MKVTKELGDSRSVTVTFGKNAKQENIDKFIEQAAAGSFGINDINGELEIKRLKAIIEDFKNHAKMMAGEV